jgi:hypothetical protein
MRSRIRIAAFIGCMSLLLMSAAASAQSTSADVTFTVPLNLTNLATEISKVRVKCTLDSLRLDGERAGEVEIPRIGRASSDYRAGAHSHTGHSRTTADFWDVRARALRLRPKRP